MEILLEVHALSVCHVTADGKPFPALRGVSFQIGQGEVVGLLGESGCGKTTLARAVLRLLSPNAKVTAGSIIHSGQNLLTLPEKELQKIRGREISMIYQEPALALNPVMRVADQVAEVVSTHLGLRGEALKAEAKSILELVGLPAGEQFDKAYPHQLSGGQRQRVVIAQAIAGRPSLLIADEPTSALDALTQVEILDLLKSLREKFNLSTLLISHDPAVLNQMADRILVMYAGRLVESGPAAQVFKDPFHPYAKALLKSGHPGSQENSKQPLAVIPGDAPDPSALPPGCAFAPRCSDRMQACLDHEPMEYGPDGARAVACFKYEN